MESPCILGEGAVIERLRRSSDFELDPHIVNSAFIYDEAKRVLIEGICRQYLDIGRRCGLPLLVSTPTWRASRERIAGLLANTAALNPEELDNSVILVEEDPETFGLSVAGLHRELGMKILGGCCGTEGRHICSLAKRLAAEVFTPEGTE